MDITMCVGLNCPLRDNCLRYKVESTELYQAYFTESPIKNGECEYFIDYSQYKLL